MRCQQDDVGAPIAQGRQDDLDDTNAVVKVFAEAAILHRSLELSVRGGDDPNVGRALIRIAHAAELSLLQEAEELGLRRQGQLPDLIQKERAAIARLDETYPIPVSTGECAADVAEQLTLDESLGQCCAVDGGERLGPPRAVAVNGAGD